MIIFYFLFVDIFHFNFADLNAITFEELARNEIKKLCFAKIQILYLFNIKSILNSMIFFKK